MSNVVEFGIIWKVTKEICFMRRRIKLGNKLKIIKGKLMVKDELRKDTFDNDISLWDSKAELEVFRCLQGVINTKEFYIFPHMPISEVFQEFRKYENFKDIYLKYCELANEMAYVEKHFELSHFDFTIYSRISFFPILIIEADGSRHKTDPSVIFSDKFKDYIASQHEVSMVRLELHNGNVDIKEELIKKLKEKNLNDPYNYPIYCKKCGKKFLYQPKGVYGSFYYCRSCNKRGTTKSLTVSNTKKNCPPLFVWDKESE